MRYLKYSAVTEFPIRKYKNLTMLMFQSSSHDHIRSVELAFDSKRPTGNVKVFTLTLKEVLVRPAGGAHPVVCVGPNTPV